MAKVLLIDDHPAVRHGLGLVLSSKAHSICGEAGSIVETLERIRMSAADIALLDLSLGNENGLDLVAALREQGIATLVYSMHDESDEQRGEAAMACRRERLEIHWRLDPLDTGKAVFSSKPVARHKRPRAIALDRKTSPEVKVF